MVARYALLGALLVGLSACGTDQPQSPSEDTGTSADTTQDVGATNACGGTEVLTLDGLEAAPGDPCGACDEGIAYCNGGDTLACTAPSEQNACGGCGPLPHEEGDACGTCARWSCDLGELVCTADACNACGGTASLEGQPGYACTDALGTTGHWACRSQDEVLCLTAATNDCGGTTELETRPLEPCGVCAQGTEACDGDDATVCVDADRGLNACGGCEALEGVPDAPCGTCGVWTCDGVDALVCEGATNACGGCDPLQGAPGERCDNGGVLVCASPEQLACRPAPANACGGADALDEAPGAVCGACRDGVTVCLDADRTVCLGASEQNACGGCEVLPGTDGATCRAGHVWRCTSSGGMACVRDDHVNACGGTDVLDVAPGDNCGMCGLWACETNNLLACVDDTPNACGGCQALEGGPGDPCGACLSGVLACAPSGDTLLCEGELPVPTWWQDNDGDSYGDAGHTPVSACDAPPLHVGRPGDCNDNNDTINPDADERVGDGTDSNCDGEEVCWVDADNDGYRPAGDETIVSANAVCDDGGEASSADPVGDCDDTRASAHPGATEVCDGVDNNCDGHVDEGVTNACGGCTVFPVGGGPGDPCGAGQVYVCNEAGGVTCEVDDICAAGGVCDTNATCYLAVAEPGYRCACNEGYSGDGATCFSCTDGVQNGEETEVDCGGVCGPCSGE